MNKKIRLKVPATSANLGSGFDAMGIALTMYCYATFRARDDDKLIISGCPEEFRNRDNLAAVAYRAVEDLIGEKHRGVEIEIDSDIPVARGLGSSAVMLTAGAFAANEIYSRPLTKAQILQVTNSIESHPDNLAPAIYGGLCASIAENGRLPVSAHYDVSPAISFAALVPDFPVSTAEARRALPKSVSFSDAVFNISRLSLLPKALASGDGELIAACLDDRLHQPSRMLLIDGYEEVRQLSLEAGASGVVISGSGPTLLCVLPAEKAEDFEKAVNAGLKELPHNWETHILDCDHSGVRVI